MTKNFEKVKTNNFRSKIAHDRVHILFLQIKDIHKLVPKNIMNWCVGVWSLPCPQLIGTRYEPYQI